MVLAPQKFLTPTIIKLAEPTFPFSSYRNKMQARWFPTRSKTDPLRAFSEGKIEERIFIQPSESLESKEH